MQLSARLPTLAAAAPRRRLPPRPASLPPTRELDQAHRAAVQLVQEERRRLEALRSEQLAAVRAALKQTADGERAFASGLLDDLARFVATELLVPRQQQADDTQA